MMTILFGAGFLDVLFHSTTGATIDRYMMPAYPLVLLGVILTFMNKKYAYDCEDIIVKKDIIWIYAAREIPAFYLIYVIKNCKMLKYINF